MADESGDSQDTPPTRSDSRAPPRRPSLLPSALDGALEVTLQDEERLLETLVSALARGDAMPERWANLHAAATRDGRQAELASAYERVTQSSRVRVMTAPIRAAIHLHAARFLSDGAGDVPAAARHAERARELTPASGAAFQLVRELALAAEDAPSLAQLYLERLPQLSEEERAPSLRQALLVLSQLDNGEEPSLPLLEALSQLEPHDTELLATLAARHLSLGHAESAASAMERELSVSSVGARREVLHRTLGELYLGKLDARELALEHLEALLEAHPSDAWARSALEDLLGQRAVAGRAAALLAAAYERTGQLTDAASMLTLELGLATGSRRGEVARALALLKQDHLDDPAGARELLEPLVSRDPADDDLRERYVALCALVDRRLDAARLLSRSSTALKDPDAKARVLSQVGRLFLQSGEERRGLTALQSVLEAGSTEPCVLRAGYELTDIYSRAGDARRVAQALARVVELEAEPSRRHPAAERLARLAEELAEPRLKLVAWSALVDSPGGARALEQLAEAYAEQRDDAGLAWVLERQAERATPAEARELIQQAARLHAERLGDRREAIRVWGLAAERYGVGAPAYQELCQLLEAAREHAQLAAALQSYASSLPEAERAPVLVQAARLASERLNDPSLALARLDEALALTPDSELVQAALWRLSSQPEVGAQAVSSLAQAASRLADVALTARVLKWRAEHEPDPARQLAAWQALARHVEAGTLAAEAGLEVTLGGLRAALQSDPDGVLGWVTQLKPLLEQGAAGAEIASQLSALLGEGPLESTPQVWVAEALAEALTSSGEVQAAIEVLRRAHAFAPEHPHLVERLEALLAQGGTPSERLAFYQEALAEATPGEQRAQLLHGLGRLYRRELDQPTLARDTWRALIEADPLDAAAHAALVEVYQELGELPAAEAELQRALPLFEGAQRLKVQLSLASVSDALEQPREALNHYLAALRGGVGGAAEQRRAEALAESLEDASALGQLLAHRLTLSQGASERFEATRRYAALLEERLSKPGEARAEWLTAADLAEHELGDATLSVLALSRAFALGQAEAHVARRLALALATLERWEDVVPVIERLGDDAGLSATLTAIGELEPLAASPAARRALAQLAASVGVIATRPADVEELLALTIRALSPLPDAAPQVIEAYQELCAQRPSSELSKQFEAYLRAAPEPAPSAFRWLFEARAARAEDPLPTWLEWAQVEEQLLDSPSRAETLFALALTRDPEHDVARCELSRLKLAQGDRLGAASLLEERRGETTGEVRLSMDLQLARLWLSSEADEQRGLELLSEVLLVEPGRSEALELALSTLKRPPLAARGAEVLERVLASQAEPEHTGALQAQLIELSRGIPELRAARLKWLERGVALLEEGEPSLALERCLSAALELPEAEALWEAAERLTRELGEPGPLRAAYAAALTNAAGLPPATLGALGAPSGTQAAQLTNASDSVAGAGGVAGSTSEQLTHFAASAADIKSARLTNTADSAADTKSARLTNTADSAADVGATAGRAVHAELTEQLGRRFVDFHEEWFDEPEQVLALLQLIVAAAPTASWALDRLKLAWSAAGRWQELFGVYDRLLALDEPSLDRATLLEEAAQAARDFAEDRPRAIGYLSELARLRPADLRVEAHLERLYEREELNRPLIELIRARLPRLPQAEALSQRVRLASLWLAAGEPQHTFAELRGCLEEALPPALQAEAHDLLEQILALPLPPESLPPGTGARRRRALGVRDDAALLLKAHYQAEGRTDQVVRMLEIELETAPDTQALIARLEELIALRLSAMNDRVGAFKHVGELVGLVPAKAEYREQLAQLAEEAGLGVHQAELLVQVADREAGLLAEELRYEAALVLEREGEAARAEALLTSVTHAADATVELQLASARRLDGLLARGPKDAERADVLEHLARLCLTREEPLERARALHEAAALAQESLGDLPRAARLFRERLAEAPADVAALDGLVATLRRAGAHQELVAALDTRAALPQRDAALRREDLVEAAARVETVLADLPGAIARWEALEEALGADEDSFHALCRLLHSEGRFRELTVRLEREATHEVAREASEAQGAQAESEAQGAQAESEAQGAQAQPSGRAQALYRRLAEVHLRHTGDMPAALGAFAKAGEFELMVAAVKALRDPELGLSACVELHRLAVISWRDQQDERARGATRWVIQDLRERWLERGRHQDVVELLLGAAKLGFAAAERRAFLYEAAILLEEQLGARERAAELLTQVVDESPGDELGLASVPRLALLLDELGDDEGKVRLWEQQAASHETRGDRAGGARLWARAAELAETELHDLTRARDAHRRGAALGGEASLVALARIHASSGELTDQIAALEWLCASGSREALAGRVIELANAYEQLGDRAAARSRLEQALSRAIEPGPVRSRLAELYRADQDYPRLAALLAEEARRAPAPRRRALFEEAAELYLTQLSDPARALPLLTQALAAEPTDVALRIHVAEQLASQGGEGGLGEAEALLREQLARYGMRRPKERASVHHRLARVLTRAGKAGALAELELAARIDPAHPEILAELGRASFAAGEEERSEQAYRALLLVLKPGAVPPSPDAPSRAEAFIYLSELAVLKDDPTRATELVESAFESALESEHEGRRFEQVLRDRRRYELLARVMETRLKQATSPADTARALADLVVLYAEGTLGAAPAGRDRVRERAERVMAALDEAEQPSELAWSALGQVYEWLGDREREVEVLERRVAAGGPHVEALYRLAELKLASPESSLQGVDLLERALDTSPDWDRADQLLRAVISEPGRPDRVAVARLLESISRVPGREGSLLLALVELASTEGAEPVREGYQLAVARGERALARELLERGVSADLAGDDAAWVQLTLGQLLEQEGELARALDLQEAAYPSLEAEAGHQLFLRLAEVATQAGDPARAVRLLRQLHAESRADAAVWRPLLTLLGETGQAELRVAVLESALEASSEPQERAELEALRGELLMTAGDLEGAEAALRSALEVAPRQTQLLQQLLTVLEELDRPEEQAEVLQLALDNAKDAEDIPLIEAVCARLGALLERQGRAEDALAVYQSALDWAPSSPAALHGVVRALEQTDDGFALAEALSRLLAVDTSSDAIEPARRLVALREAQGEAGALSEALASLYRLTPADREVRERLVLLYQADGAHSKAASVLAQAFAEEPQQSELLRRLVAEHRQAGELEHAVEALSAGLAMWANEPSLLAERAALLEALGRPLDALDDHERLYAKQPEYGEQLAAALKRAVEQQHGDARRGVQKRLVTVLTELSRFEEVLELLEAILTDAPGDVDALKRSASAARALNRFEAEALALEALFEQSPPEHQVAIALDVQTAWASALRPADARPLLEAASRAHPDDAQLRAALGELYSQIGAHAELGALLLAEAHAIAEPTARAALLQRAGALLLQRAPKGALAALREAAALVPDDLTAVAELARALVQVGETDEARSLLSEALSAHRGRRSKGLSQLYWELSRLELGAGALSEALEALNRAFELDPRSAALAMELGELALDLDDEVLASRSFRAVTMMRPGGSEGEAGGPAVRGQAYFQLGRLAHRKGDDRKARMLLAKCLSEAPGHAAATALMSQLG